MNELTVRKIFWAVVECVCVVVIAYVFYLVYEEWRNHGVSWQRLALSVTFGGVVCALSTAWHYGSLGKVLGMIHQLISAIFFVAGGTFIGFNLLEPVTIFLASGDPNPPLRLIGLMLIAAFVVGGLPAGWAYWRVIGSRPDSYAALVILWVSIGSGMAIGNVFQGQ
jgi:hypothetical protein